MKRIIPALAALAVLSAACTKEINENEAVVQDQQTLMTKLVGGTDGEILPGSVLVKLDAETASVIRNGGFAEVSEDLFGDIDIQSFSPAIPARPRNIEVAKKYGLDRWFSVRFSDGIKPQTVASKLAESPMVVSVQYEKLIEPIVSERVFPFEETAVTKAGATLFDDPYSGHQWNLYNDGSIAEDAVAGADAGVKDAWRLTGGDPSVVVAVIDEGVQFRHEDLKDAMWQNEAEVNGESGVDDDGNGFIDDKHGFNFVNCFDLNEDYVNGKLEGGEAPKAVSGNPINANKGSGHGTHVAGIIAATNGNGKGISSVAGGTGNGDGVRIMSCQAYEGNAYCIDSQKAAAFIYAADNGACIAQCSYGSTMVITNDDVYINGQGNIDGSPLENAALRYFLDPANSNHESLEGNIAVFSAGNFARPYSMYPGALPYVLSVTATGYDFLPAGYTHYGPGCKIAAPGGEFKGSTSDYSATILSTGASGSSTQSPGLITDKGESKNYVYMQGTSMACPHVSGVIALGISYAKKLGRKFSREEMTSMLLTSVNDIDQYLTGTKKYYDTEKETFVDLPLDRYYRNVGTGSVNAWKFLMAIEGTPSVIVEAGAATSIDLSPYCNPHGTYSISVGEADKASLGLESDPVIKDGKLEISCGKVGAGKIVLRSSVGKDETMEDGIGSMDYYREISIVSREFAAKNGGWL